MTSAPPRRETTDLPPAFNQVLLTAEVLRARTLAAFFGVLLGLIVLRALVEVVRGMGAGEMATALWPSVAVLGGLVATEVLAWRMARRHRDARTAVPGVVWLLLTLAEVGGLTGGLVLLGSRSPDPDLSGEVAMLLLFLSLSALRLSFGAVAFTGVCAAAGFLVLVAARTPAGLSGGEN